MSRKRAFILTWSKFEYLVLVPFSLEWNIYFRGVLRENERSCRLWVLKLDWVNKKKKKERKKKGRVSFSFVTCYRLKNCT